MPTDAAFLWQMLYLAGHVAEDGGRVENLPNHPTLAKWVRDWPARSEFGYVASDDLTQELIGAIWVRFFSPEDASYGYVNDKTPELAIAVLPEYNGHGVGTKLLVALLDEAQRRGVDVCLTVRADNRAHRLYSRLGFVAVREVVNRVGTISFLMVWTAARTQGDRRTPPQ